MSNSFGASARDSAALIIEKSGSDRGSSLGHAARPPAGARELSILVSGGIPFAANRLVVAACFH